MAFALKVTLNSHSPQLCRGVRESLEAAHRDQLLINETDKKLAAVAKINLLDCHEVSLVLLLIHAQRKSSNGAAMESEHRLLVFGSVTNETHRCDYVPSWLAGPKLVAKFDFGPPSLRYGAAAPKAF